MSIKRILLVILLVLVLGVVLTGVVLDQKFGAITAAPKVSYEKFIKPETRALLVLEPALAEGFIAQLTQKKVPSQVLDKVLPYEGALVIDFNEALSDMRLTAFLNAQRLGPILCAMANEKPLPGFLGEWMQEPMKLEQRGELVRTGNGHVDRVLLDRIKSHWKDAEAVDQPLKAEGGHAVELVLDNRDGAAVAIVTGLVKAARDMDMSSMLTEGRLGTMTYLQSLRLQADMAPNNDLKLHLVLQCSDKEAGMVSVIGMAVQAGFVQLQSLVSGFGITIQGTPEVKGNSVVADFTIPEFDKLIQRFAA